MRNDRDFKAAITDADLESPLDRLPPLDGTVESKPDPEAMLALLYAPDSQQRILAARAFCELQDERAVGALLLLLRDPCPLVRVSAAYALGRNPSPEAVEPLIAQLQTDLNGYVRKGVTWALGNCRDRQALPSLIEALRTDIAAVRLWAASSLGQAGAIDYEAMVAAVPPLVEALRRDTIPVVRSNTAWALGQICRDLPSNVVYATVIDALIEALVEDGDMGVREDARSALLKVGDPHALQMIEALEQEGMLW